MTTSCFLMVAWIPLLFSSLANAFVVPLHPNAATRIITSSSSLKGSFFDDLFGVKKDEPTEKKVKDEGSHEESIPHQQQVQADNLSLAAFQKARDQIAPVQDERDDEEFDGYVMRDIIVEKWGQAYDLEFQRVEAMGFKEVYLNVMPFRLGSRNFRHETEFDYLCHLQAVVEILLKYNQVGNILYQIDATNKKPRAGTSPLVAVPLRLDLTPEQVDKILGP